MKELGSVADIDVTPNVYGSSVSIS